MKETPKRQINTTLAAVPAEVGSEKLSSGRRITKSENTSPEAVIPHQGEGRNVTKKKVAVATLAKINIRAARLTSPAPVWCLRGMGVTSVQFWHTHNLIGNKGEMQTGQTRLSQNC